MCHLPCHMAGRRPGSGEMRWHAASTHIRTTRIIGGGYIRIIHSSMSRCTISKQTITDGMGCAGLAAVSEVQLALKFGGVTSQ
jgi:hypothetical protein